MIRILIAAIATALSTPFAAFVALLVAELFRILIAYDADATQFISILDSLVPITLIFSIVGVPVTFTVAFIVLFMGSKRESKAAPSSSLGRHLFYGGTCGLMIGIGGSLLLGGIEAMIDLTHLLVNVFVTTMCGLFAGVTLHYLFPWCGVEPTP